MSHTLLPAERYHSPEALALELRRLYAGGWTCLGRRDELFGDDNTTQRAAMVGDVGVLLTRDGDRLRMFANTCRHRGHELLPEGGTSTARAVSCPYHAWSYDLGGRVIAAPGFPDLAGSPEPTLAELPLERWHGWVFGHALHRLGTPEVPDFGEYVGDLDQVLAPYAPDRLHTAVRHTYEVAANWKVIAENYHECYHCPQIHPELCAVSPPTSGRNYDLPGAWVGGVMELREGMVTMSLDGQSSGRPIDGAPPGRVEYVHLMPNLLVSAHPDYVMTHRLVPLAPGRTWVECTWLMPEGVSDARYAVDFWDLTNRQDWAACESVQRGTANPHFTPGRLAPTEDALVRFTSLVQAAYTVES